MFCAVLTKLSFCLRKQLGYFVNYSFRKFPATALFMSPDRIRCAPNRHIVWVYFHSAAGT